MLKVEREIVPLDQRSNLKKHFQNLKKVFCVERDRKGDNRYENSRAKKWVRNCYEKETKHFTILKHPEIRD